MADGRFDFHNPFMSATIITTDGRRFPLWLKTREIDRQAVHLDKATASLPFLQELSVEIQLAYLPIIKATLAPPYKDAKNFLDSDLIEWGQSILEVQLGYIGSNRQPIMNVPPFSGVILKPDVALGQDITVTLNAQGVGGFAASRQGGRLTMNDSTRKEIATELLKRFKLEMDDSEVVRENKADTTASSRGAAKTAILQDTRRALNDLRTAVQKERNPKKRDRLQKEADIKSNQVLSIAAAKVKEIEQREAGFLWLKDRISYAQGGDSYWTAFLKILREAGLHAYLIGNTARILPTSYIFASTPQRVFRLYDFPGGRLGSVGGAGPNLVFPILGVSSPTMAVYLPAAANGGYWAQDINSGDRQENKKLVGEKEVAPARTGKGGAALANENTYPAPDKETGEGAESFPGNPGEEGVAASMKSEYTAMTTQMGIQLTIESLGDPTLFPGTVIAVRGLGRRIDANYSVLKVTHTIGTSGYAMSMECVSNVDKALAGTAKALGPNAPEPQIDEQAGAAGGVEVASKNVE